MICLIAIKLKSRLAVVWLLATNSNIRQALQFRFWLKQVKDILRFVGSASLTAMEAGVPFEYLRNDPMTISFFKRNNIFSCQKKKRATCVHTSWTSKIIGDVSKTGAFLFTANTDMVFNKVAVLKPSVAVMLNEWRVIMPVGLSGDIRKIRPSVLFTVKYFESILYKSFSFDVLAALTVEMLFFMPFFRYWPWIQVFTSTI
jgi:hypothetical protein